MKKSKKIILVTGTPGTGKTAVAKFIARKFRKLAFLVIL